MGDLQVVITDDRHEVGAFVDAARRVPPAQWTVPRAAGKWSPGQVTEHVALTYEQSRRMLLGTFTGPVEPWFRQVLARWLFLRPMFKRGDYGKGAALAPDFIAPSGSPAPTADLLARLEAAVRDLETDLTAASNGGRMHLDHPIFGRLGLADLLRFVMLHTQHHRPQLSPGAV
jgi:hypothetical protein